MNDIISLLKVPQLSNTWQYYFTAVAQSFSVTFQLLIAKHLNSSVFSVINN